MSTADRANKRMKGDGPINSDIGGGGLPPPDAHYGQPPTYSRGPYGGGGGAGPPMQSSYMYGGAPPPPHYMSGGPPPPGMYRGSGGGGRPSSSSSMANPDHRSGYGPPVGYPRGPPPPMQMMGGPVRGRGGGNGGPPPGPMQDGPPVGSGGYYPYGSGVSPYPPGGPPPPHSMARGGGGGLGPYGGPPPPPSGMYGTSPPKVSQVRPRGSPELLGGGPGPVLGPAGGPGGGFSTMTTPASSSSSGAAAAGTPSGPSSAGGGPNGADVGSPGGAFCQPVDHDNVDPTSISSSRSVGTGGDEDGSSPYLLGAGGGSTGGGSNRDKGRGSYKCGRCGVPKKGHVCPYQPKLTRKVGEPLPEMRSAAIQVEMDEFMTLRRLNLRIQGFPESYAAEPYGEESMVVGEPAPAPDLLPPPPLHAGPTTPMSVSTPMDAPDRELLSIPDSGGPAPMPTHTDPDAAVMGSQIRSSPMVDEAIPGAA